MADASSNYWLCSWMQFPCIFCSNALIVMLPFFSYSFRNYASFTYCLSYYPTCLCRRASSESKAAVGGCWKEKSNSSILTAVGRVVNKCSKELSVCEMGRIAGSWCSNSCRAVVWPCSGYSGCVGAGRASMRGDDSMSVSLTWSAAWRLAICLVYTIV